MLRSADQSVCESVIARPYQRSSLDKGGQRIRKLNVASHTLV
jgi:hypothetical protein